MDLIVKEPQIVRFSSPGEQDVVVTAPAVVYVYGGTRTPGAGPISFGVTAPETVTVVSKNGEKTYVRKVGQVVFSGGTEGAPDVLGTRISKEIRDAEHAADDVFVTDNWASQQIEDTDHFDPVDADQNPFIADVVDDDGSPGNRPYVDAANKFEKDAGLEDEKEIAGDELLGDEFQSRIEMADKTLVDSKGRPLSDLAHLNQIAEAAHAEDTQRSKYVNINPESAYRGVLGGQAVIVIGAPPQQIALWGGEDVETKPVSVIFSPVGGFVPAAIYGATVFPHAPFGIVQWGTRSFSGYAEVDINRGCQFTIAASQVSLQIGMDNNFGAGVIKNTTTPPESQLVGGMLSFFPIVRTSILTRTLYINSGDVTATVTVPPFAKKVYVLTKGSTAYTLSFQDSTQASIYSATFTSPAIPEPIPIANDIVFIVTTVSGPATIGFMRFVFELSI